MNLREAKRNRRSSSNLSHVPRISLNIDLFINLVDIIRRGTQTEPCRGKSSPWMFLHTIVSHTIKLKTKEKV